MALTIEVQVSTSGLADSAFSDLVTVPESDSTPGGYFLEHTAGVIPGRLYIFRSRRRDDSLPEGYQYSDWSHPYAFARVPYPVKGNSMNAEDIITGVETAAYIGTESVPGIPVKVTDIGAFLSGGVDRDLGRVYGRRLRNKPTMRRTVVAGVVNFTGSITVEVTPEGFYPRLMNTIMKVSTESLTTPTRYRHTWVNDFGSNTVTLVIRKGDTFFVYPGTRATSYTATQAAEGDSVAEATFDIVALDELVFELAKVPTILTDLGISGAAEDPFPGYSQQDAELLVNNAVGGTRSLTFTVNSNLGQRRVGNGKRGATGTFERGKDTSGSGSAYYENNENLYKDFGLSEAPTTGFAVGCSIVTGVVKAINTPCIPAGYDFAPVWEHIIPNADIKTATPIGGPDEVPENLTFAPIDLVGASENTDVLVRLTNSETGPELVAPSAPFVGTDAFEDMLHTSHAKAYEYGVLSGTPTTTVIAVADNRYIKDTTTVDNDVYNGRKLKMLSGTEVGEERTITDYVAATRTFTVSPAFDSAPAAGDIMGII